ncbi:SDR family oxidoreductase [Paenibacillus sp. P96]|uniref:SDR family oxidoreductase n=1 Tax=Paenibacillus zeirhizosphaerae TaxID=2987519 RepID=A0ABT9FL02_9BACL|nr:SDR family oxidoreductase [Paenibacillus sp. P96]MDP4095402.1 SDR family oxidoreductase [Paenibacillus sp. P96]
MTKPLQGKVAVVAGATRGAGRAIAVTLGTAGATVYCTGRSIRGQASDLNRPETIEDTADMINERGGTGIAVQVDHTKEEQVKALFERIKQEQQGRLHILVNDIWGGDKLTDFQAAYWRHSLANGLLIQERAVKSHMITSYYGTPLLIENPGGLIIEVTDGIDYRYRGNLYYSLAKVSVIHLAAAMAEELRSYNTAAISVTPGFLRSEEMLDHFRVTEQNWQDAVHSGIPDAEHFGQSETPYLLAQGVAALAADPEIMSKSGKTLASWELSDEYGFVDVDGRKPHWGNYAKQHGFL